MAKRIEFFYDIISPYTWYAFEVMMRYRKHWSATIELKPFFLGAIMKGSGNKPPGFVPNKAMYMMEDLPRLSRYFNVPLNMLSDPGKSMFEKGSLIPCRFLTATDMLYPDCLENVTRAIWMELWNKDEDITSLPVLERAGKVGGLDDEQLKNVLGHMTEQVTKDRLKAYSDLALEYGAFGSPTIVAHTGGKPMMFFGSDRFPVLANEIGEKWLGPDPDNLKSGL
ncbi:glutathione S-transferase kappa 1-like [Palaemon carinicauda]|uniref:glutathione S-transferase kappa 1-like n=1 Tax=Palaemon carinicauda TaxID=392227 RepID=UPI0035B6958E